MATLNIRRVRNTFSLGLVRPWLILTLGCRRSLLSLQDGASSVKDRRQRQRYQDSHCESEQCCSISGATAVLYAPWSFLNESETANVITVVIKYFGFELGAQTNTNPADDRWIINGAHEASKLQDYLDGFINKFVLCKMCKNPETEVKIKDGHITLDCKACGRRSDVDLRLKLSSFILKNQPKKGKKDKAEKKARRAMAKENGDVDQNGNGHASPEGSNSDNADAEDGDLALEAGSDDELTRRINAEAKDLNGSDAKDDQWTVDVSEAAVKARAQELPDDFKQTLTIDGDDEDAEGEGGGNSAYDQLGSWVITTAQVKTGGVKEVEDVDIYIKAKELGIETKHKTLTVLAQTIFDDSIVEQVPARASMLKKVCLCIQLFDLPLTFPR